MKHLDKEFTFKINRYLDNPFDYPLKELCAAFSLSEEEVQNRINDNAFLNFKYQSILFSKKTTADELYQLLLTSDPPVFESKKDLPNAMENPAFNVTYAFYLNDEKTVDYFKIKNGKKLKANELNTLLLSYLKRSPLLTKEFEVNKIRLGRLSNGDFSSYTF